MKSNLTTHVMQGGKKGGGNQKKGSAIGDLLKPRQPFEQTEVILQTLVIIENHRRKVGRCSPAGLHALH